MEYKVCILAAGTGSRMGKFTKVFNKALIPLKGKPAICHIIDKFSIDTSIVIAVGYKKDTIIEYLTSNYPKRNLKFISVDKWSGEGSGPGYSLLCCKEYLQTPFIQFAADTLVAEDVPYPSRNYIGLSAVKNTKRFCSVKVNKEKVTSIDDKTVNSNKFAYIGLFGVNHYNAFWDGLEVNSENIIDGEAQVSNGLSALIGKDLNAEYFSWFDVGTLEAYTHAQNNFPNGECYMG